MIGIYQSTPDGRLLSVNRAAANICGFDSPAQQLAETRDVGQDLYHDPARRNELARLLATNGVARDFECEIRRRDGKKAWLLQNVRAVRNEQVETVTYEGTVHDITERKLLEEQLRQAQKMEAVGRLAGGVAHDFNNALSVIMGYGQLLQLNPPSEDTTRKHAEQIVKAGQRAASLTRQLLAFSRKQTIQPVILDLNSVVSDANKMLRRLIGEDIDLTITQDAKLKRVKADRGQIEQILMNLAVNARDAMPTGGELTIATSNCELGPIDVEQHPFVKPGHYVLLSFTDTGSLAPLKLVSYFSIDRIRFFNRPAGNRFSSPFFMDVKPKRLPEAGFGRKKFRPSVNYCETFPRRPGSNLTATRHALHATRRSS